MFFMKNIILFLFVISIYSFSFSQEKSKEPIKVTYGIFIKKIVPNFKDETFYAEFYWWVKFKNDSAKSGLKNTDIVDIQYVNSQSSTSESEIEEEKYLGNNMYYYEGYHQGNFFFNPDYRHYPFDEQILNITIENKLLPLSELEYEIDTASFLFSGSKKDNFGLSNDVLANKSSNFKIDKSIISTKEGIYNSNFGDVDFPSISKYSRIDVGVLINRSFMPFITKLIIPLAIILFLVYFVFFIPADKIDIAAGLTVTSLLSAIAFQLSVNSDLPDIGYIIYVDKVFYSCYFLIAISMAESLYTFYLDKSGDEKKMNLAIKIDVISRFLFPIIFAGSVYLFA